MKVLLISPPFEAIIHPTQKLVKGCMPPLSLMYLAGTLLKNGIETSILDLNATPLTREGAAAEAVKFAPDLIGFTTYSANIELTFGLARALKLALPRAPIVLGGIHASYLPENCLAEPAVDAVVRGEGELTLLELARAVESGTPWERIKGLVYRGGGALVHTRPRETVRDIDSLPWPAHRLIDVNRYFPAITRAITGGPFSSVLTMRGCAYRCSFCSHHYGYGGAVRLRSITDVADEIEFLRRGLGVRELQFEDNSFSWRPDRALALCRLLRERKLGVSWNCTMRADTASEELLREMKAAGCERILLGAESGDQAVLDRMHKGHTLEQVSATARWARKYGIRVNCSFVLGMPGDTEATLRSSFGLALELDPDYVMFSVLTPSVGSEIFDRAVADGKIEKRDVKGERYMIVYSEYPPLLEMSEVPAARLKRLMEEFTLGFYARPRYILRRLAGLGSPRELLRLFFGAAIIARHQLLKLLRREARNA